MNESMDASPAIRIETIDLENAEHVDGLLMLLNDYSCTEFGNGRPLDTKILEQLIPGLRSAASYLGFLAYRDQEPVGLANCFRGFSTFRALPLINVHDLCVHRRWRGQGIGRKLLSAVAEHAEKHQFCRVTLEVRSDNEVARGLYESMGFQPGAPEGVQMEFLTKSLPGEKS